jgi:hypothetical protein
MAVLINRDTRLLVQGLTGREGTVPREGGPGYGTNVVGRRHAGQGRDDARRLAVFNTVADAVKKTGANAVVIFVPPPAARRGDGSGGRRLAAGRLHHRRHSGHRHDARHDVVPRARMRSSARTARV